MTQSLWEKHSFLNKILEILPDEIWHKSSPHMGKPFLSSYQLAIEFANRHSSIVAEMNLQIGGKGIEEHVSLAQYISRGLSQAIANGNSDIDGGFLTGHNAKAWLFTNEKDNSVLEASTLDLSIWRRK